MVGASRVGSVPCGTERERDSLHLCLYSLCACGDHPVMFGLGLGVSLKVEENGGLNGTVPGIATGDCWLVLAWVRRSWPYRFIRLPANMVSGLKNP